MARLDSLSEQSAWPANEVERFLGSYRAPLRLAVSSDSGFPLICSLWFAYEDGRVLCATTRHAKVVECIRANPKCGFELAPNDPPYFGVRGQGVASVAPEGAMELLGKLIDRYLGTRDTKLARWLLSRSEDEVVLAIDVQWLTSWDYRSRMPE